MKPPRETGGFLLRYKKSCNLYSYSIPFSFLSHIMRAGSRYFIQKYSMMLSIEISLLIDFNNIS